MTLMSAFTWLAEVARMIATTEKVIIIAGIHGNATTLISETIATENRTDMITVTPEIETVITIKVTLLTKRKKYGSRVTGNIAEATTATNANAGLRVIGNGAGSKYGFREANIAMTAIATRSYWSISSLPEGESNCPLLFGHSNFFQFRQTRIQFS